MKKNCQIKRKQFFFLFDVLSRTGEMYYLLLAQIFILEFNLDRFPKLSYIITSDVTFEVFHPAKQ